MFNEAFFAGAILIAVLSGWCLIECVLSFRVMVREWRREKAGD